MATYNGSDGLDWRHLGYELRDPPVQPVPPPRMFVPAMDVRMRLPTTRIFVLAAISPGRPS